MPIERKLSDLRGTRLGAFGIQDADLTRSPSGLDLDANKFFGMGLGALGTIYDLGSVASSFSFDFAGNGVLQACELLGAGPYAISSSHPPLSGWVVVYIQNNSGVDQIPVWNSHFEFGPMGPPYIPDGARCTVMFFWDASNAFAHGVHNCPGQLIPGMRFTDTGIQIAGGAKGGAAIDTSLVANIVDAICTGTYDYSTTDNWQLQVYPTPASGSFVLDVRKRTWGNTALSSGDSVCASAKPTLAGNGTDFTASGATSTWTAAPINRGDMLAVAPTVNTALVKQWVLYIPARRTF